MLGGVGVSFPMADQSIAFRPVRFVPLQRRNPIYADDLAFVMCVVRAQKRAQATLHVTSCPVRTQPVLCERTSAIGCDAMG